MEEQLAPEGKLRMAMETFWWGFLLILPDAQAKSFAVIFDSFFLSNPT